MDFGTLGFVDDPSLQTLVDRATALFEAMTGRVLDATMPSGFDRMVEQVVQRMVEILAFQAQQDYVETLSDFQLIASFSAGSYSESRRGLKEVQEAKMLVADPALNSMMMLLLTPDQRDFWDAWWTGEIPPSFEVTEVDWSGQYAAGRSWYAGGWGEPIFNNGPWSL